MKLRVLRRYLMTVAAGLVIAGCGANWWTIYRESELAGDDYNTKVMVVDANQRAIFSTLPDHPTANLPGAVILCAEPSPDALTVLSSAASAKGSFSLPSGQQFQGQVAQSVAQAATALGRRNATMQLLRDANYRLCEARLDGFITNGTYPVMLNRYADGMVTLLSIEQLTTPSEPAGYATVTAPVVTVWVNGDNASVTGATAPPTKAAKKATPTATSTTEASTWNPSTNGVIPTFLPIADGATKKPEAKKATPTATSGSGKPETSEAKPTDAAQNQGAGVNPATASAVSHLVSIYQYKNLEETCLTLAAARYKAEFIILNQMAKRDRATVPALPQLPSDERIWRYCDIVMSKLATPVPESRPTASPSGRATPGASSASRTEGFTDYGIISKSSTPRVAAHLEGFRSVGTDVSDTGGY